MKRFLSFVQIAVIACAVLIVALHLKARAQGTKIGDYSTVPQVPRDDVNSWLRQQVKNSGGDWDKGRYSFYIGFSTGGYASDPVMGTAMMRLAFGLMNNTLAVGDRITPIAWELKNEVVGKTSALSDDPKTRGAFVDGVPGAPFPGSDGGHDIERTLYDTVTQHIPSNEQSNSVVILLTTSYQSMASEHGKDTMFGANSPMLTGALAARHWLSPTRKQFTFGAEKGPVTIYVTALFPEKLESLPDAPGTPRYPTFARNTWQPEGDAPPSTEKLPNPTSTSPASPPPGTADPPPGGSQPPVEHGGIPWWVWLLLVLVVVGVILFMVMSKRSGVQRPLQPVAATVVAAPKVETIPGSLRITIGPDEQTIAPLAKGSTWTVSRQADGVVKLIDTSKTAASAAAPTTSGAASPEQTAPIPAAETASPARSGTTLAKITFGGDRTLHAVADSGAQFAELQGTAADRCDSRSLLIEPGKRVLCRVQPPDAASKTRFEIVYDIQAGKGSRV